MPAESLPQWHREEPLIDRGVQFYITAFFRISTSRPIGMSVGQLSWADAVNYAKRRGFSREAQDWFADVMCLLDDVWSEWIKKRMPKPKTKGGGKPAKRRGRGRRRR